MPAKDKDKRPDANPAPARSTSPTASSNGSPRKPAGDGRAADFTARPVAADIAEKLLAAADAPGVGGPFIPDPAFAGAVAFTHFDSTSSEDDSITILLPKEGMERLPAQSLVKIRSRKGGGEREADGGDATTNLGVAPGPRDLLTASSLPASGLPSAGLPAYRDYLAVVIAGPFAEPDGLKSDSSLVVATTLSGRGNAMMPRFHGRALVQVLGEIDPTSSPTDDAPPRLLPPQYRPRPNSPVFPLDDTQTARFLKTGDATHAPADARLGLLVGRSHVPIYLPTASKAVLPRHTGILGTTGGGKSTTVAGLVHRLQLAGVATVIIDVEGEYTEIDKPTTDDAMLAALKRRGLSPAGVKDLHVLHPVGRETSRQTTAPSSASGASSPAPGKVHPFSLKFSELSPYAVTEILEMPDAQRDRFFTCFDVTRALLRELKVYPASPDEETEAMELDELDTGVPRMTVHHLMDITSLFIQAVTKEETDPRLRTPVFADNLSRVKQKIASLKTSHDSSWRGLMGRLARINRLKIFDNPSAAPLRYAGFLEPGRVSVVDLSDTDEPQVRNLIIADLLRGIQREQEHHIAEAQKSGRKPTPCVVIVEEAHEFLSAQRIKQMPTLFQQVARIARRGRKRWLGLVFVTQLPQHLPDEVLGLINNFILHKISDAGVVDRLRKSITGLDRAQWSLLPGLPPGQAVMSLTSLTRPLLVTLDPAPCRLRLVD